MSFPTRERGLKCGIISLEGRCVLSFPTRERGLKSLNKIEYLEARGRSPRGNVD